MVADQNLITGASTKVTLMKTEQQLRDLVKKNSMILSESLRKYLYREDSLNVPELYQCAYTNSMPSKIN